ncbi:MAG: caspase domain-containing protein, partial [Cyanophyceae cyanobacterium]
MPRNWALVVGINRYDRLRSLRYAERDAELVRDYLHTEAGFEQVFHFSDNSPDLMAPNGSLQSTRPTYANLWSFLWDFFESPPLRTGDNFWFFFSGHGIRFEDRDYLMPSDGNPRAVDRTGIPLNYVTERLRRCGADNVV